MLKVNDVLDQVETKVSIQLKSAIHDIFENVEIMACIPGSKLKMNIKMESIADSLTEEIAKLITSEMIIHGGDLAYLHADIDQKILEWESGDIISKIENFNSHVNINFFKRYSQMDVVRRIEWKNRFGLLNDAEKLNLFNMYTTILDSRTIHEGIYGIDEMFKSVFNLTDDEFRDVLNVYDELGL